MGSKATSPRRAPTARNPQLARQAPQPVLAGPPEATIAEPPADPSPSQGRATRPGRADHAEIRLWLRLLFCANRIESILQSRLNKAFGLSLARFDLLAQLERAGEGLTMTEVSRRMMVTNGATTSLVDRLVEDGLVSREAHPQDRRTNIISLTPLGRDRFLAMAREHEGWLVGLLSDLDPETKTALLDGLGDLKHRLDKITE
ncbi:MarR family winged helix-turn-helix transcriptional regulator [Azospirillum thermophilum]|uniref:MarR family transcriptional regulator n=1 Tax=Azospirillum thermophilum TaxID=2202148 RepID=A0A2S2CZB4_9PROT|nr:MarR family transcriptional regulator [Azospirillum thermophilum]AWK89846.1 MarR family transcriptional regulator [Azospirillum thermophilum]